MAVTADDGVEIGEWHWRGTYTDGSPFAMRGVMVIGVEGEQIAWARVYMDAIADDGATIEEMVTEVYRPPAAK